MEGHHDPEIARRLFARLSATGAPPRPQPNAPPPKGERADKKGADAYPLLGPDNEAALRGLDGAAAAREAGLAVAACMMELEGVPSMRASARRFLSAWADAVDVGALEGGLRLRILDAMVQAAVRSGDAMRFYVPLIFRLELEGEAAVQAHVSVVHAGLGSVGAAEAAAADRYLLEGGFDAARLEALRNARAVRDEEALERAYGEFSEAVFI